MNRNIKKKIKGRISSYNVDKGYGFIIGENNQKYFFHISNVVNPVDIKKNKNVDFKPDTNDKGFVAKKITILEHTSLQKSKDKMLRIHNIKIMASLIKSYYFHYYYGDEDFYVLEITTIDEEKRHHFGGEPKVTYEPIKIETNDMSFYQAKDVLHLLDRNVKFMINLDSNFDMGRIP